MLKLMKLSTSNEDLAFEQYEQLSNFRKKAEGVAIDKLLVDSDDPKTKLLTARLKQVETQYNAYNALYRSSSLAKLRRLAGRSGISPSARQLALDIADVLSLLIKTTHQRGEHKILSPLAFQPNLASIPELETAHLSTETWIVDFKQGCNSSHSLSTCSCRSAGKNIISATIASLLAEFGLTEQVLFRWWRDHHLDKQSRETVVWNDMRAMARKMVFMLDYCADEENLNEPDLGILSECTAEGQRIAIAIITLVDRYPTKVEDIRPSMEFFIPILFILSESTRGLRVRRSEVLDAIGHILLNLKNFVDTLGGKLEASQHSCVLAQDNALMENADTVRSISEQGKSTLISSGLVRDSLDLDDTLKKVNDDISMKARGILTKGRQQDVPFLSVQDLKRLQLDKIELEREYCGGLGSGSSALVKKYNAQDRSRQYAVKIYKLDNTSFDEKRHWNRIIREAEFWIKADHKNINKLVGFCTFEDSVYPGLVMDVCEDNLIDYCSTRTLEIEHKLNLIHDVASGLKYLHEREYAHGDLRPENILIKRSQIPDRDIAVLTDFGFADATESSFIRISMRTDGQRAPEAYRAPEFYTDRSSSTIMVSKEADIYAFGCVFVEIVYGSLLYSNVHEPLRKLKEDGVFPVAREKVINAKHWLLLRRLWDIRPERRPNASVVHNTLAELVVAIRLSHVS